MSLESALHRVGQMEKETRRRRLKEQVAASRESLFGEADFALMTGAELEKLHALLTRLAVPAYADRGVDAAAVLALVEAVNARDKRPDEPGGRSRWFRPRVSVEEVADEVEVRAAGGHRLAFSEGVAVRLSFDPRAVPAIEKPKQAGYALGHKSPKASAQPAPTPVVEESAAVVPSGRVTRILRAKTVAEQRAERAVHPENPLAWPPPSRRDRSISEREF